MFNSKKDYPEIVHTIHNEFNNAGEKILQEAEAILADCSLKDKTKGKLLSALGFSKTPQAVEVIELENKQQQAETNARLIHYYAEKYPLNKFITDGIVKSICEKYGLVCGNVSLYKGFVPQPKLEQIASFKLRDEDTGISFDNGCFCHQGEVVAGSGNYFHIYKKGDRNYDNCAFQSNDGIDWYSRDKANTFGLLSMGDIRVNITNGFEICAPEKDMDVSNHFLKGFRLVKNIPDPVVLQRVNGGYLIVAAWGDEASDENVVNKINN